MNSIKLYTLVFFVETIIILIVLMSNYISDSATSYSKELQFILLMQVWKLLIYYIPLMMGFIFLCKYVNIHKLGYMLLLLSIFNVIVFICLNFLYLHMDLPSFEINDSLFWATVFSIVISPIALGRLPYFRRLMGKV